MVFNFFKKKDRKKPLPELLSNNSRNKNEVWKKINNEEDEDSDSSFLDGFKLNLEKDKDGSGTNNTQSGEGSEAASVKDLPNLKNSKDGSLYSSFLLEGVEGKQNKRIDIDLTEEHVAEANTVLKTNEGVMIAKKNPSKGKRKGSNRGF